MQRIFDNAADEVGAIFFIAACIAVVVAFGLIALLIWMLISGVVVMVRYRIAYAQAGQLYDEIQDEVGASYEADNVIHAVFGAGLELPKDGYRNTVDWLENTIFGVKVDNE